MKKVLKKAQAFALVVSICLSITSTTAFAAEEEMLSTEQMVSISEMGMKEEGQEQTSFSVNTSPFVFEAEGYRVISTLLSSWEGGFNASIVIENTGNSDIRNWHIKFPTQYVISNVWNAEILSYDDDVYLLKNADWNGTISVGGCVEFGVGVNENFVGFPSFYEIVGTNAKEAEDNYEITYSVDNVWDTGFTGSILINNLSLAPIEDWTLEFDTDNEITNMWNANIVSHEGIHYVIQNAGYNCDINTGESVSVGFIVSEGNSENTISNISLTAFSIEQTQEEEEREKEPLKDLTESYIKPATEEDIVFDKEEGVHYVKNQVMVGAYLGTPKSVMENLAEEIGAEIVGYVELIEDYQFEFTQSMSYSELMDMVVYLEGIPYVDYAELNLASPCEVQFYSNDELYEEGAPLYIETKREDTNNDRKVEDKEYENIIQKKDENHPGNDGWTTIPDGNSWGLEALNVPKAWDYRDRFQGSIKVGIYDNMFGKNEDLVFDDIINNPREIDKVHGTHVAGIIGAEFNNETGISGVATDVRLYGNAVENSLASYASRFTKLIENDVRVINVSYSYTQDKIYSASANESGKAHNEITREANALSKKLKKLIIQGYDFLFVVAAGNGNGTKFVKDSGGKYEYSVFNPDDSDHLKLTQVIGNPDPKYSFALTAIGDEDKIVKNRIMVVGAVGHSMNGAEAQYYVAGFSQEGDRVDTYAPGEKILSTVPNSGFCDSYMLLSGTSMAAPYISGLAALILQANPELTAEQVKEIIIENQGTQIGTTGKYMPDAEACILAALNMPGGGSFEETLPQGTLRGKTVNSSGEALEGLIVSLVRTSVGQSNLGAYYFTTTTKSDGSFEIDLLQGTYEMVIYGETFYDGSVMPFKTSNIVIEPDTEKYLETTVLFLTLADQIRESCNISGSVYDALTGKPVKGAAVNARAGWNTYNGPYVTGLFASSKEDISDANGVFDIHAVRAGQYTVEIKKDGYVIGYYNMISQIETDEARQTVILTPELSDDEYRIVLTWGAVPSDLDSHLTYYEGGELKMHVYYSNKIGTIDGVKVAELDLDDTSGYGPETVTLTFKKEFVDNGKFVYFVHNYSAGSSSTSTTLSQSGATVRLYCGNNITETFYVPENKKGTVWKVFEVWKEGIRVLNDFYSSYSREVR